MTHDLKDKTVNVSISTVISLASVLGIVWFVMQPIVVQQVSAAISDDIDQKIHSHQVPISSAFKVLLKADIDKLKRSIAMLEWRESHEEGTWLAEHAALLAERKIELEALEAAYAEL